MILNHFYPRVPQTSEYQPLVNFAENSEVKTLHTGEKAAQYAGGNYGNHQRPLRRLLQETVHCFLIIFTQTGRPAILRRSTHSEGSKGRTFPTCSSTRWKRKARRRAFRLHSGGTERERGAQGVLRVPVMGHGAIALRRHAESVWLTIHPHKKSPVGQFRLHGGFLRGSPVPPA